MTTTSLGAFTEVVQKGRFNVTEGTETSGFVEKPDIAFHRILVIL